MAEKTLPQVEEFFSNYRVRKYAKGQILILNGDTPDHIFNLVKGRVKVYDVTYRGEEIILTIFKPDTFFPMSIALNKSQNPYIYEADTDIEVRQAPSDEVLAFLKNNPDVMIDLLSRVYSGVDGLLGRIVHLMSGTAKSRVVYELVLEVRRFGEKNGKGGYSLDITEKDLGSRAGLSRETVSREINKLKTEKLIEIHPKEIIIPDVSALETMLKSYM